MSFLGHPFQHDIFINYSHGAFDGKCDTDLKKWSLRFADSLRSELAGTGEFKNISVFVDDSERADESVDRAEGLTSQLRHKAENSALLTVLMTPQYLDSSWCRDERGWWHANHHADTYRAGGRIFVCRVRPTDETLWPAELCDERRVPLVGYFCFDRNKHPDKARPFTWLETTDDLNEYKNLLSDVSGDMMCRLRAIKVALEERLRREQDAAHLAADSGQVIYLHGRRAHADVWKLANQTLDRSGFVVFPDEPDPVERDPARVREIAERRIEILSGCDGLLLLGTDDVGALEADLLVVGRRDRHSARARSDRVLPCAVLDTIGPQIAMAQHKVKARKLGIDWIETAHPTWPTKVKNLLVEASAMVDCD